MRQAQFNICSTTALIDFQENDPTLVRVRELVTEDSIKGQSYLTVKNKILYRVYPREVGYGVFQKGLPQKYRTSALRMAHDIPLSGHMGVKKTRSRILQHFLWPGIFSDVARYCRYLLQS